MKKRLYRVLITLTMVASLFCSACSSGGNDTASEEPSSEVEESTEESKEAEETASEDIKEEKVEDGEYKIYPTYVKTFTLKDDVLTFETADIGFEDFPIPEDMEIKFEYPLADDFEWDDSTKEMEKKSEEKTEKEAEDETDWFEKFSSNLKDITTAANKYKDGKDDTYKSGKDFCEKNATWIIVIKDEEVVSISVKLADADTEKSETAKETKENKEETEKSAEAYTDAKDTNVSTTVPSAKEDTASASTPTVAPTAPVHTHSYSSSVTKQPTCGFNGVKTYTCSCGDSYTESISGGDHNWNPIYGTIEHPSMGEMRQVQVGTSGDVYICNYCGAQFGSSSEFIDHKAGYAGSDNNHARATHTIRDGGPVYENQWVVTQEAWTETIVTSYQCSICGATK